MASKKWYESRTTLAGIAVFLIEVLGLATGAGVFEGLGLAPQHAGLARNWAHALAAVLGLAVVAFRRSTETTIEGSAASRRHGGR